MGAKTLLIGMDAADPRIIDDMIADGKLPTFAALKNSPQSVSIENYPGMGAGVFWPSAATGGGPGAHGRYFQFQFDPETYQIGIRDDSLKFKVGAVWNDLDQVRCKVGVIDWPRGPFKKVRNGFLLDNWLTHEAVGSIRSHPVNFASETLRDYGGDPWADGISKHHLETLDDYKAFIATALNRIETKTQFSVDHLKSGDWAFFAPVFSEPHDIGHYAHHLHDAKHHRHNPAIAQAIGDPYGPIYEALDAAAARLIEAAGSDAAIFVFGGPGMMTLVSGNSMMNQITQRLDQGMSTGTVAAEWAQGAYRSSLPLWLRTALSPITKRVLRRPAQKPALAARRFFAVPHSDIAGCIRINLKGREKYGIVEPGAECEALIETIISDLMDIRDTDTGAPVVDSVERTNVYDGAYAGELPDLFVVWRREARFNRITSPKIGVIENSDAVRTGDHTTDGFLWARNAHGAVADRSGVVLPHIVADIIKNAVLDQPATQLVSA